MPSKKKRVKYDLDLIYNCHQIERAVEILVKDAGDIRNRLFGKAGIELVILQPDAFPQPWREDVKWIKNEITRCGNLRETFYRTYTPRAEKIVERVWVLYCRLEEIQNSV